jgi:alcohol dehydrogenase
VLGHEPAGRVVAVGDRVERVEASDRVAVPFDLGCGTCPDCTTGHGNVCPNDLALGFEADAPGAFAERVHVPHADYNAVALPAGVDPAAMAALGCRYATAFNALADRAGVDGGEWVAVVGCGGVGLSAIEIASALGAGVVAVDVREAALEKAREVGADATVDASERDTADAIRAATGGGADVTVDALGSAETCRSAVDALARRGRHVQVGLTGEDDRGEIALPTDRMARREVTFLGARGMPVTRYPALLAMIERGRLDPGRLVTRRVALADVPDRLAAMTDYDTVGVEVVTEF